VSNFSHAQIGKANLVGFVKSNQDNSPVIFATVYLYKENVKLKRVETDLEGKFQISNLDSGLYTLKIAYFKHDTLEIEVLATPQLSEELKLTLDPTSSSIETVTLKGGGTSGSGMGSISARKIGAGMIEIMGAESIKQTPASGAGDVLKKLSGASIQDNKFAIIRGLNDRYNFALLNGAPLPSSEADRKAFSFDLFPSSQIESMSINKTATPDMPSEFAGGVISIVTRDIPAKKEVNIGLSLGYHNLTTLKPFATYNGGKTDFLGFDDGTRAIPKNTPDAETIQKINNKQELIPISKNFNGNFGTKTISAALPNLGINFSYALPFKIVNREAGINFSTVYNNGRKFNEKLLQDFGSTEKIFSFRDESYTESVFLGGLLNFSLKLNKANKIGLKSLLNLNSTDETILRTGTDFQSNFANKTIATFYQQNLLASSQLVGEHAFKKGQQNFDWNIGYSKVQKIIPDFKRIRYLKNADSISTEVPFVAYIPPSASPNDAGRFYSTLNENIVSANYNYQIKNIIDHKLLGIIHLKVGGFHQIRNRTFDARVLGYTAYKQSSLDRDLLFQEPDKIFNNNNISPTGFIINDNTNKSDAYTGNSSLNAGYLMLDENLLQNKLRLVYGARVEYFNQKLNSFKAGSTDEINVNSKKLDILPSININYELAESTNLRLGASKTLSRPEFRELAPFSFFDFARFIEVVGNDKLERTSILNFDARLEHYFKGNQFISLSAFYKDFSNPIEQVLGSDIGGGTLSTTYQNAKSATNFGIEFEIRKNLAFLLRDEKAQYKDYKNFLYLGMNFAYIQSQVDVSNINGALGRPLQGQSPYVFNGSITYDNPAQPISFGISGNRVGNRIVFVGTDIYPDFYEKARTVIDGQITYKTGKDDRMNIKLQFSDILGQEFIVFQNKTEHGKFIEGNSRIMRSVNPGNTAAIAVSYRF